MSENSADPTEQLNIANDDIIKGFQIVEKIDEGAYGQVFKVSKSSKKYAMKVEANRCDGGQSSIRKEMEIIQVLNANNAPYFPKLVYSGMDLKFSMLVMTLLGENLKKLRMKCADPYSCTTGTWSRVGIQCLYVLKQMHDCGLLHHDLKPSNFVMGNPEEPILCRVFHLIDFGISRKFIRVKKGAPIQQPIPRKHLECRQPRKVINALVGTPTYASPNAHLMVDLSRVDDCWSLLYMVGEMVKPLPWDSLEGKQLETVKLKTKLQDIFNNSAFNAVEEMLRACDFYSFPNYELIYNSFKTVFGKSGVTWMDPYDWESKQMSSYINWKKGADNRSQLFPWESADVSNFFKEDPFKLCRLTLKNSDATVKKNPAKHTSKENLDGTLVTEATCEEILNTHASTTKLKQCKGKEVKKVALPK